jgi:glutaredoxin 2
MYFVSSQSETEQINDIVEFMAENMNDSVTLDKTSPAFADFSAKVTKHAQT